MGTGLRGLLSRSSGRHEAQGRTPGRAARPATGRGEESAKAVMHIRVNKCEAVGDAPVVAVLMTKRLSGGEVGDWKEVDRMLLESNDSQALRTFQSVFQSHEQKLIRIELRSAAGSGEQRPKFLGAAETLCAHLWESPNDWVRLKVRETGLGEGVPRPIVGVIFEQLKNMNHNVELDISVVVRKKGSWPFTSSKPFYIVYRSEPGGGWSPLYRSEVLLRPTERRGVMRFRSVELKSGRLNDFNDNRSIRIEFLQFRSKEEAPRVLGHIDTSVAALRQAPDASRLNLELHNQTEGELSGMLSLKSSSVNAARSSFLLEATFGDDDTQQAADTDTLFLDLKCSVERSEPWPFSSAKLFFVVTRTVGQVGKVVYTSEVVSKPNSEGVLKFELATLRRMALDRAERDAESPVLELELFHFKSSGEHRPLGYTSTTLDSLRSVPPGGTLEFHAHNLAEGAVRGKVAVEQAEASATRSFFALHVVLSGTEQGRRRAPRTSEQSDRRSSAR